MKHFTNLKTWLLAAVLMLGVGSVMAQAKTYSLVTSTSELEVGAKYLIVGEKTSTSYALGLQNNNNRASVEVSVSSNSISAEPASGTSDTKPFEITLGGSSGAWTLYDAVNSGYLYAPSSSSNQLKTQTSSAAWTITVTSSGVASMKENGTTTRDVLKFNSGNNPPLFSCYASGQADVYLYKEVIEQGCTPATVSFAQASVEKSVLDAAFTNAFTSNNTSSKIYSSTDTSVATVNASNGLVTIVGAGTTTISVSQVADGIRCAVNASYELTINPLTAPVATAATSVSETGFTANWNAVAGVSNYKLEVYSKDESAGGGTNLITNSGFEAADLSAWTFEADMNQTIATDIVYSGSKSLQVSVAATKKITQKVTVESGESYTLSFYYYLTSGSTGNGLRVWTTSGANIQLPSSSTYFAEKGSWQHVEHVFTATANEMTFELRVYNGATLYLDDISIKKEGSSEEKLPVAGSPFSVTGTSKAVTGLLAGTEYFYAVQAVASGVTSAWSNEISVTTSGTGAPVPSITVSETSFSLSAAVNDYADDVLEVEAANLTADIELAITGTHAAMFSYNVDKDFDRTGGIVLVTYAPTAAGSHTATLTLSSTGAASKQIALNGTATGDTPPLTMPDVIITEVYGGGGNTGATLKNDFIELYNTTDDNVSIGNWSVQYYSTGLVLPAETSITIIPNGKYIPAKTHFLIQAAAGNGGTDELILPDVVGAIAMSGTNGKVILFNTDEAQTVDKDDIGSILGNTYFVDYVPYGTAVPVWGSAMVSTTNVKSATRKKDGSGNYIYTGDIGNDFELADPSPQSTLLTAVSSTTTSDTRIYATNKLVYVHTTVGTQIEIYNIAGQKVISQTATVDGFNRIPVSHTGILVVKAGEVVGKVVN